MCRGPVKKYVGFHSPPLARSQGPTASPQGPMMSSPLVIVVGRAIEGRGSGLVMGGREHKRGKGEGNLGRKSLTHPPSPDPTIPPSPRGGSHRPSPCPSPIPLPTPFTLLTPFALPTLLALLSPIAHHPSPITPLPLPKAPIQSAHSPALAPPTHHSPPCSSTIHPSLTHPSPIPRPSPKKKVAGRFLAQRPRPPAFSPSPYFVIADSCGLS